MWCQQLLVNSINLVITARAAILNYTGCPSMHVTVEFVNDVMQ